MSRIRSSLALVVGCAWALGATAAFAADMSLPTKAPPPAPTPSWWSAFAEVTYEAGQVNPQGQAVYKNGDIVVVAGANLTLYKDKAGFINNVTVGGLAIFDYITSNGFGPGDSIWASLNPAQDDRNFYHILAVDGSVSFAQYWTLSDTYFMFSGANANGGTTDPLNAAGANCTTTTGVATGLALGCAALPAWYWNELKLSLNDGAITGWPISFNPYVTWYLELYPSGPTGILGTGTSAACFSCNNQGTDFIIGMTPKISLEKYWGIPLTLTAPTWVTVGQSSFWNAGAPSSGNVGVFTTGLTGTLGLTWVPAQYGHWFAKAGFQWFDIINTSLQADNLVTYGASFGLQQNIVVGFVGLGVGF